MISFLKLIRWLNLLAIGYTFFGVLFAMNCHLLAFEKQVDFILLALSTMLIAGAGNAINDYFDLRADRVNKTHKMVIGRTMKKRSAILIHWTLNLISVLISVYLSYKYQTWFYIFIHFFSTTLLWVYSVYLKKITFWSNISIALLVSLIPLVALYFLKHSGQYEFHFIYWFVGFAFLTNLNRELVKDIQDMPGDKLINVKSIPLVYGVGTAKRISMTLSFLLIPLFLVGFYWPIFPEHEMFQAILWTSIGIACISWVWMVYPLKPQFVSSVLKITQFVGISALYILCH